MLLLEAHNHSFDTMMELFNQRGRQREIIAYRHAHNIITIFLVVVGIVGCVGNFLVIYVFSHHLRHSVSNLLITFLAAIDFIICLVDIPATLYWNVWKNNSLDFICKLHTTLKAFFIPASVFLLVLIAIDRFLLICFVPGIRIKRKCAYTLLVVTILTSLGLALPMGLHIGVRQTYETSTHDLLVIRNISLSSDYNSGFKSGHWKRTYAFGHCETDHRFISIDNYRHYTLFNFVLFILMFLVVAFIYSVLFLFIWFKRSNRSKLLRTTILLKQFRRNTSISMYELSNNNPPLSNSNQSPGISIEQAEDLPVILASPPPTKRQRVSLDTETSKVDEKEDINPISLSFVDDEVSGYQSRANRESIATCSLSMRPLHVKTARTLAVVTATFAISYLPYFLIVNEFIWPEIHLDLARSNKPLEVPSTKDYLKRILFYMYFVNSATNPIIYSCMNQTFRRDLALLFDKIKLKFSRRNSS